jgi:hypothetical protein
MARRLKYFNETPAYSGVSCFCQKDVVSEM